MNSTQRPVSCARVIARRQSLISSLLPLVAALAIFVAAGAANAAPIPHFRTLAPPKVLMLGDTQTVEQIAHMWEVDTGAVITTVYFDPEPNYSPLTDSAMQATAEVDKREAAFLDNCMAHLSDYDIVIVTANPGGGGDDGIKRRMAADQRIADWVRAGGRLIYDYPTFDKTPLAAVMPAQDGPDANWTTGQGASTDHPLTRGIPMEVAGAHFYGPVYQAADASCVPLTTRPGGAQFWYRDIPGGGKVAFMFQDVTEHYTWNYAYPLSTPEHPDDLASWRALHQRMIYWIKYGDEAYPVLAKILPAAGAAAHSGQAISLPVDLENRSTVSQTFNVNLDLSTRRSDERVHMTQSVTLAAGERRTVSFDPTVDLPCIDPYVLATASVVTADGAQQLSESTTWLPFVYVAPLTVATPQPAYAAGAPVQATVSWKGAAAGKYNLDFMITDYRGRVLSRTLTPVTVGAQDGSAQQTFRMPGEDLQISFAYYITAILRSAAAVAGTAHAQVQLDEPWSMRRQMQFSTWTGTSDPDTLALMTGSGLNALGQLGNANSAERYNLHQYVEGTGINTFGVTIDDDNWTDVQAAMEKTIAGLNKEGPESRSISLVSLGEESGFGPGWGVRFYWPGTQAPPIPQKVFDNYLSGLYAGDIARLNDEWGSTYSSFTDVPLLKSNLRDFGTVFVNSALWATMDIKAKADATPIDFGKIDPAQKYLTRTAPFYESNIFFDWYYQKVCDLATKIYHAKRNPVPLTMMSAPGGFYPTCEVPNLMSTNLYLPKEYILFDGLTRRASYGDVPGFSGAQWEFWPNRPLWNNTMDGSILVGDTNFDYWVDFPLTFNPDLTDTRASFWGKAYEAKIHPINPILLHKQIAYTKGLGMFVPSQPLAGGFTTHFGSTIRPNTVPFSALEESGLQPRIVQTADLKNIKLLVACFAQVITPTQGKQIADFVQNGGTLFSTPDLGICTSHGNVLTTYPAPETGLDRLIGFRLLDTSQAIVKEDVQVTLPFDSSNTKVTFATNGHDTVLDMAPDVKVLARYKDGTPLLLSRSVGKGRVIYLNMIADWEGGWEAFYGPTREAYRELMWNVAKTTPGIQRDYFVSFNSIQQSTKPGVAPMAAPDKPGGSVPWWCTVTFSDPSGRVKYLSMISDFRSRPVTASVHISVPHAQIYDLFTGALIPQPAGQAPTLTLKPGDSAFWAILPEDVSPIAMAVSPIAKAGSPVAVALRVPGNRIVRGVVVDVYDSSGSLCPALSTANVNITGSTMALRIPTAFNDAAGRYRVVLTDSLTRHRSTAWFTLTDSGAGLAREVLQPFPPRLVDNWATKVMTSDEFLANLRKLRTIYLGSYTGLDSKYELGYYQYVPFMTDNRHAIVRDLQRTDWTPHLKAVADAIAGGEHFVLDAEDLNVDPESGLTIDPMAVADPATFLNRLAKLPGAHRRTATVNDLSFDIIEIGGGSLVVCKTSLEVPSALSADFAAVQDKLKTALQTFGIAQ